MKRRRFDFFKGKKIKIKRFVFTKMTSFRFMLVWLIGRIKDGSVRLSYQTGFQNKILYQLPNQNQSIGGRWRFDRR
jgi:hypothetical protein